MRDHREHLSGVLPIVITFTDDVSRLGAYRDHLAIDFPLLADPHRSLYGSVGAGRGALHRVWSPGTLAMYVRLVRRGRRLRPPSEDTRQLGADLLVDASGRLVRAWLPDGPDRRPSVDELADAARSLLGS